eukprot:3837508-Lingulodinium_polyedra.AAC.1
MPCTHGSHSNQIDWAWPPTGTMHERATERTHPTLATCIALPTALPYSNTADMSAGTPAAATDDSKTV